MKYFLCDVGHVLVDFDFQHFLDAVSEASGRTCEPLTGRDREMHDAVETGHISNQEWVDYLNQAKGLSWSLDDLVNLWSKMFKEQAAGRELFLRAVDSGASVYALSNIAGFHMDAIEQNWPGYFEGAEGLFLSYQMGFRKPHPAIYQKSLDQLGVEGHQCFFLDDLPENIEAARAVGIEAHRFDPGNIDQLRNAVSDFFA